MRFTATIAGIATVASAIKIQDAEVYSSGPLSFDASVTIHCNDCEFEAYYEEPAQGSSGDVAEYKEWVWCREPIHNEENWFWSGVDCVDRWDEEDYSYYLFSGCSNCVGDECHECDWYSMADDQIWMDDYQEAIYCEAPEFDDYYWTYSSDNCSTTFDEDVYNHYCDSCSCGELSDGSFSCDWCWYCIEGEEDIYGQ